MSIYNVSAWASDTNYSIWSIAKYDGKYYYSLKNNNLNQTPSSLSEYWGGVINFNNSTKPHFVWRPNYNSSIEVTPFVKRNQFGDGYEQRIPDGINNTLLKIDLTFELRPLAEITAINHFLVQRAGVESFVFTPPKPFDSQKLFACDSWSAIETFYDNHAIQATFTEKVN